MVVVKNVEKHPYVREHIPTVLAPLVACIAQDVELDVEEFFKLEAQFGACHVLGCFRIMNVSQRRVARNEV